MVTLFHFLRNHPTPPLGAALCNTPSSSVQGPRFSTPSPTLLLFVFLLNDRHPGGNGVGWGPAVVLFALSSQFLSGSLVPPPLTFRTALCLRKMLRVSEAE